MDIHGEAAMMKALADALADDAFSREYITHLLRAPARPTYAIHTRSRSFSAPPGRWVAMPPKDV